MGVPRNKPAGSGAEGREALQMWLDWSATRDCPAGLRDFTRAALSAAPSQGWREIESAPADGTRVLAFDQGLYGVVRWHRNGRSFDGIAAWRDDEGIILQPTHWMPLPAAPQPQPRGTNK